MSRFRTRWLAFFGGVTLIALSLSTAFAGKPDGTHRGPEVSAYVHSLVGDVEEAETEDETEVEDEVESEDSTSSDHGDCVADVAQDEDVGGENENHGGAVSEAARVTCWEDSDTEESSTEDEGDSEVESDDDAEEADSSEADSEHGEGHGDGHGGDSSDD